VDNRPIRQAVKLRVVLAALLLASTAGARTFVSKRCDVSFRVPDGWTVTSIRTCELGLRPSVWPPPNETDFGDHAITIRVTRERFEDAARKAFFFRDMKSLGPGDDQWDPGAPLSAEWVVTGRLGVPFDAYWIRSGQAFGLIGAAQIGYKRPSDPGLTALGAAYRAVVSTGFYRTAIFHADNPVTGREFAEVVQSFRFR
jgi:hypothetical protein